jgi:putative salt-induced outer membrane protein YdiY
MNIVSTTKTVIRLTFFAAAVSASAQMATNAPPPAPKWQTLVSAGLTLTRGNSDTTLATLTADTDRKTEANEWNLGTDATYGQSKSTVNGVSTTSTTAQNVDGHIQYNQLFTDRFYGYARVEALHDDVANIHYSVTVSPGAGYYFIKNTNTDLSAEVGPGYVFEKLDGETRDYTSLRVSEKFHQRLTDRARLWETAEWQPDVSNFSDYVITAEIGVEADITASKSLSLQCYLDDSYYNEPAPGRLKNDAKLVMAIAYKF